MPDEPRRDRHVARRLNLDRITIGSLLLTLPILVSASPGSLGSTEAARVGIPPWVELGLRLGLLALALAGLVVGIRLARSLSTLATARSGAASQSAEWFERLQATLERIAEALERSPEGPAFAPSPGPPPQAVNSAVPPSGRADTIRAALADYRWEEARSLAESFLAEEPDSPEARRLVGEVENGRATAIDNLRARLDASRTANDPEAILEFRDRLLPLLDLEDRGELDRDLIRWFLSLLMRRLRTGNVQAEVVALASRLVEVFPDRPEGASLRASLPTLRRSAGLCPRCAKPYRGIEDACPDCLATTETTILPLRVEPGETETDDEATPNPSVEDDPFVREPE